MRASELRLPEGWPRQVRSAVVHAVSMAHTAFSTACGRVEDRFNELARLRAENDRFQREVSLLLEELRIKDARMEKLTAQRRPHYPAVERLAILELRAARGWSLAQTARRMLVTPLTVVSWMPRLDDEGPDALVQVPEPVNRFPGDFSSRHSPSRRGDNVSMIRAPRRSSKCVTPLALCQRTSAIRLAAEHPPAALVLRSIRARERV